MNPLKTRIIGHIQKFGPITTAEYMGQCLLDPVYGYYPTRDPLGADGDFITAPEISQMFGEMIGLWALQSWIDMGRPPRLYLIELGPGRGVMMSDILRAGRLDAGFIDAADVILVEASAALQAVQGETLASAGLPVRWLDKIEDLPPGPCLIIGNEFLDCLPIRQFIQKSPDKGLGGWHERMVTVDENSADLAFACSAAPISRALQDALPEGQSRAGLDDLLEVSFSVQMAVDKIAQHFERAPGRALFIDYGPAITEFGDSLQALKRHQKVGVFSDPGNTDLTARVDFGALSAWAQGLGLDVAGPTSQKDFLARLGIEQRALNLAKSRSGARPKLVRQLARLMDEAQMGTLFKAVCLQSPNLPLAAGF